MTMDIQQNISLKKLHTFGFDVKANQILHVYHENQLLTLPEDIKQHHHILGGGSNILICHDVDRTILKNEIKGIDIVAENDSTVTVEVGAGENWHQFVMWSISHKLGGLENLSLIPGTVGAAPMQNIGAYGVEQNSCFVQLTAVDIQMGKIHTFTNDSCQFGYRESVFKRSAKGQYFITRVQYILKKKNYTPNISYGAIKEVLLSKGISAPDISDVSQAVIDIRTSKLPDPAIIGNAGSFFKNPVISTAHFKKLLDEFPDLPSYPAGIDSVKVPAGWLIEKSGLKGYKTGHVGVHQHQALVLVHFGEGKGSEILSLSNKIIDTVWQNFNVRLEREVNIWNDNF